MEKLISEFSSGLFLADYNICYTNFLIKKIRVKPILDTVNEREKSIRDSLNSAKEAKRNGESSSREQRFFKKQGLKVMR